MHWVFFASEAATTTDGFVCAMSNVASYNEHSFILFRHDLDNHGYEHRQVRRAAPENKRESKRNSLHTELKRLFAEQRQITHGES